MREGDVVQLGRTVSVRRRVAAGGAQGRPLRSSGLVRMGLVLALLPLAFGAPPAAASPDMPAPSYDNTFYAFVYDAPLESEQDYVASRDALLARVAPGPYARVGFTTYYAIDLPWNADLAAPVLTSPSRASLEDLLARLEDDGLVYHVSAMLGMSRFFWIYADAKEADRRNAQWYADNLVLKPGQPERKTPNAAWVTPSRYARKLRRHMEAKTRAFAQLFEELRAAHPQTLISASGDAEAELSDLRVDPALPADSQMIADYSPFAILEFRDWLLRTGLYAADGPYAGQGYKKKRKEKFAQGTGALTAENLTAFNAVFGTAFTSWELEYFPWSLDDPIDGDPHAIKYKKYKRASFAPLPASGANHVPGGFDAPRGVRDPSKTWWKVWLKFRQRMLANFARDVATWITTPGPHGEPGLPPTRWYSHQIPADYLNGTQPGEAEPLRLRTSASTLDSSLLPSAVGSPGLTVLDRFELANYGPPGGYNRTSAYSFDAMEALQLPNWGIPEYSPSWTIDVVPDTDVVGIAAQWSRAHAAGAHMAGFTPWPHFAGTVNGEALGVFVRAVADAPRAGGYVPLARDAFVTGLYTDLLQRAPSAAELTDRVAKIADGSVPRPKLFADLLASSEGKETVVPLVRLYLALLGRQPTMSEFAQKTAFLTAPQGAVACRTLCRQSRRQTIVDELAATSELQARFGGASPSTATFVTKLFESILGRSPKPAEQSTWVSNIDAKTVTRSMALRQIAEGGEAINRYDADTSVVLAYAGLLARMPSDGERAEWRARLEGGLSRRGLAQAFLISEEYRARF
ncbi:DUF4214 domain-containing protein [Candidatus Binatia bacterium]|nr:DUF4214 domain-containing protein [Candidatus Binatia bacterium]